jgi:DNA-binding beta-propeller fold protein YncE
MKPFRWAAMVVAVLSALLAVAAGLFAGPVEPAYAETPGVIFVVDQDCCNAPSANGGVIKVDLTKPISADQTIVASGAGSFQQPVAAAIGIDGTLYVVDLQCCGGTGGVIKVDLTKPAESTTTVISSGQFFERPSDIAVAPDGKLYVVDQECCAGKGALLKIDPGLPATNNQTVVSELQSFVNPSGVALAADGKIYVVDFDCCTGTKGGVIRVDPTLPNNANQTIISQGQHFAFPLRVAVAADGTLYVVDSQWSSIASAAPALRAG